MKGLEAKVQGSLSPHQCAGQGWQGQRPLLALDREWYWLAYRHIDVHSTTM